MSHLVRLAVMIIHRTCNYRPSDLAGSMAVRLLVGEWRLSLSVATYPSCRRAKLHQTGATLRRQHSKLPLGGYETEILGSPAYSNRLLGFFIRGV